MRLKSGFVFFKQKTAYEMCGRDWSSDVCSSDLAASIDRFLTKAEYEFLRTRSPSHDLKVFLRLQLVGVYFYTSDIYSDLSHN